MRRWSTGGPLPDSVPEWLAGCGGRWRAWRHTASGDRVAGGPPRSRSRQVWVGLMMASQPALGWVVLLLLVVVVTTEQRPNGRTASQLSHCRLGMVRGSSSPPHYVTYPVPVSVSRVVSL
jgi:hypothetical protein